VHILSDVFAQHKATRPDYLTPEGFRQECADTVHLLERIAAAGGRVSWVGKVGLNPYAGRYHAKVTVIDDDVLSFGGVNFTDDSLNNVDYMLSTKDDSLAQRLAKLVADNANDKPATDTQAKLTATHTMLFDAGNRKKSIIYDRACELAQQSTRITYVSQMCPSGKLAQFIKHVPHTCYFNRPERTGLRPDTLAQLWDGWRAGVTNHYEGAAYLHAKFILFELKDGTKACLSGSHNFSWRGVAFGTKEIALLSTDPVLWRRMQDMVYKVATQARTR
jgi:phosphatidylserine/phosphatidylglycerophosphate/cardiolipin synthase-like enzyme